MEYMHTYIHTDGIYAADMEVRKRRQCNCTPKRQSKDSPSLVDAAQRAEACQLHQPTQGLAPSSTVSRASLSSLQNFSQYRPS